MARVELAAAAVQELDRLIRAYHLPRDTRERLKRSIATLERFPLIGPELGGRWSGFRFLLGPWRWLVVVYVYLEDEDRVVIVTVQDGRSSSFAQG